MALTFGAIDKTGKTKTAFEVVLTSVLKLF